MRTPDLNLLRSRRGLRTVLAAATLGAGLWPATALAQGDIDPPLPNVLLLIDSSGSMENMVDGQRPEAAGAACTPGVDMTQDQKNRWAILVSALTGSMDHFSCEAVNRSSGAFKTEYTFDGAEPYDADYYLPYHRPLSNGCSARPGAAGQAQTQWFDWPAGAIEYHPWNNAAASCTWDAQTNGVLDTFETRARFGLMTFDSTAHEGTGASGSMRNGNLGMRGMWSYYPDWSTGTGTYATGNPPDCVNQAFDVGARNPAAPQWEGRLIPFGQDDAALIDVGLKTGVQTWNARIQEALIAMRPYGATPIAGMMKDARDFLLLEQFPHPTVAGAYLGPERDRFVRDGCRRTAIILLSDGEPNLDMRPSCTQLKSTASGPDGACPYPESWETANELATNADVNRIAKTHTIAFGIGVGVGGGGICSSNADCPAGAPECSDKNRCVTAEFESCTNLVENDTLPGGLCDAASGALNACCNLARIAFAGKGRSYFATDENSLRNALSEIISESSESTARTYPVFASGTGTSTVGNADAIGFEFVSSFVPASGGKLWTGKLERRRYECPDTSKPVKVEPDKGDVFQVNVNNPSATRPRRFFTAVGELDGTLIHSARTLRPAVTVNDGLGLYGSQSGGDTLRDGATFASYVDSRALSIDSALPPGGCSQVAAAGPGNGSLCADRILRWNVGQSNAPAALETRADAVLGSFFHSTPTVVGLPREFLRDESYAAFAEQQVSDGRPIVLYAATTDGQLHAFKVASTKNDGFEIDGDDNNELWSFFPPYVLPRLLSSYDQQALLLDGAPVVKDVVFERSAAQAIAGSGAGRADWRTILLAGGGSAGGFYYALDITDPAAPKFLWQIAADEDGVPLFGRTTPTPAITTLSLQSGSGVKEVAVAILPGGSERIRPGSCPRDTTDLGAHSNNNSLARAQVRCWGNPAAPITDPTGPARSVMVVRLDTGEILMSFRGELDDGPAGAGGVTTAVKDVPFDSPMTGVPVPYPSQAGQVANRVYIGDSDGTLWRIELSSTDPADWDAAMAWDAYPTNIPEIAITGEAIQTTPIVSADTLGKPVILFSTGDQDQITETVGMKTRVWSITEIPTGTTFFNETNWYLNFDDGVRVTGPLSLFNSTAYFATYAPKLDVTDVCSNGEAAIWGVHYLDSCGDLSLIPCGGSDPNNLPRPAFANDPLDLSLGYTRSKVVPGAVFGVAVTQAPSCVDTTEIIDPYLGSHTTASSISPGKFQLVYQTGAEGTPDVTGSTTNTERQLLPSPRETTRIDSWASIIE